MVRWKIQAALDGPRVLKFILASPVPWFNALRLLYVIKSKVYTRDILNITDLKQKITEALQILQNPCYPTYFHVIGIDLRRSSNLRKAILNNNLQIKFKNANVLSLNKIRLFIVILFIFKVIHDQNGNI